MTVLFALAAPAQGPLSWVDVTWTGPSDCDLRDAFLEELGHLRGFELREHLTAQVEVTRDGNGRWRVVLVIRREQAESRRVLEADTCDAAVAAAALITAVASDDARPLSPPQRLATNERPANERERAPRPLPPARRRPQLHVSGAATGNEGTMPAVAPGVEASIGAALPGWPGPVTRWLALVSGVYLAPQTHVLPGRSESAEFRLAAVSGRACASLGTWWVDVGPCLGAELDVMSGAGLRGAGAFSPSGGSAAWASLVGSALASLRLTREIGLFVRVDANFSISPPHFDLLTPSGRDTVVRPSTVAGRAAAGVEVTFF